MSHIAIKVENLSKRYRIGLKDEMPDTFVGAVISWLKAPVANFRQLRKLSHFSENGHDPDDIIWALKDVSFDVKSGEVVGIIGRNGAGKSTLLKILSRITEPTAGRAIINGRVSSLLEVGTGFHPELTGRENVYLNGTVLGMSKAEIDRKFDEIIDFSGVKKFIDTPVKRYSSGMQVRLAFAVAAHLEPEVLVVDEVLAVGDAEFQKKCLGKMKDVAGEGRTVLFVSHNMAAVENLCSRSIMLDQGKILNNGPSTEVIHSYLKTAARRRETPLLERKDRTGQGMVKFSNIEMFDAHNFLMTIASSGADITFAIDFVSNYEILERVLITLAVYDDYELNLFRCRSEIQNIKFTNVLTTSKFYCHIPRLPLPPGYYSIYLAIVVNGVLEDKISNAFGFQVVEGDFYNTGRLPSAETGKLLVDYDWTTA